MKLFMEVNPTLFDECSHEWSEANTNKAEREKMRQSKWDRLAQQADVRKSSGPRVNNNTLPIAATTTTGLKVTQLTPQIDGASDPFSHDKLSRFGDLQIQEASVPGRLGQP